MSTNPIVLASSPMWTPLVRVWLSVVMRYPSKYEVEAITEFLLMKPEIETLTIGELAYIFRACPRQSACNEIFGDVDVG